MKRTKNRSHLDFCFNILNKETAMGQSIDAQSKGDSEYVKAVYKLVLGRLKYSASILIIL